MKIEFIVILRKEETYIKSKERNHTLQDAYWIVKKRKGINKQ